MSISWNDTIRHKWNLFSCFSKHYYFFRFIFPHFLVTSLSSQSPPAGNQNLWFSSLDFGYERDFILSFSVWNRISDCCFMWWSEGLQTLGFFMKRGVRAGLMKLSECKTLRCLIKVCCNSSFSPPMNISMAKYSSQFTLAFACSNSSWYFRTEPFWLTFLHSSTGFS